MNKMAAYYIYLMRFGGVDQTVKNSMLTTEGSCGSDDPNLQNYLHFGILLTMITIHPWC